MNLQALKGKVTGKQAGRSFLVRSVADIGETLAMVVGQGNANSALSEDDLIRMRVAENVGNASDQQIMEMMTMEHIVVSLPANTEIYVIFNKSQQTDVAGSRENDPRSPCRQYRARFEQPATAIEQPARHLSGTDRWDPTCGSAFVVLEFPNCSFDAQTEGN